MTPAAVPPPGFVAVCQKWVDRRPEVDALTGAVSADPRTRGPSAADQAALEWALRAAGAWGSPVLVVTAGPVGADGMLREALAAGADRAVRVDLEITAPSPAVAAALAGIVAGAALVLCGDWSLDRGSGSVPAYLA
ncbi:MAG: putative mycofactocin-associated electron transfer flavoprotein, partial [Acidimicrobiales bacterium]